MFLGIVFFGRLPPPGFALTCRGRTLHTINGRKGEACTWPSCRWREGASCFFWEEFGCSGGSFFGDSRRRESHCCRYDRVPVRTDSVWILWKDGNFPGVSCREHKHGKGRSPGYYPNCGSVFCRSPRTQTAAIRRELRANCVPDQKQTGRLQCCKWPVSSVTPTGLKPVTF